VFPVNMNVQNNPYSAFNSPYAMFNNPQTLNLQSLPHPASVKKEGSAGKVLGYAVFLAAAAGLAFAAFKALKKGGAPKITTPENVLSAGNYKQTATNFCHFATPMGKILDDPELNTAFTTKIVPSRIKALGNGNFEVLCGGGKSYIINESALKSAGVEGPKEAKLFAKAYEKYLMEKNPRNHLTADGNYRDTFADVQDFFHGLFNIGPERALINRGADRWAPDLNEFLRRDDLVLFAATNPSPAKGLVTSHWHFIKSVQGDNITLGQPKTCAAREITLTLQEFKDNFQALTGFTRSGILKIGT